MTPRSLLHSFIVTLGIVTATSVLAAAPAVVRIGVATQGYGDPPVFGGSPAATAQLQHRVEDALKPDGIKVEWLFFKGAGPAVNEALAEIASRDPGFFVYGQDVGSPRGGVFGTTQSLVSKFPGTAISSPLNEQLIFGIAAGASMVDGRARCGER